MANAGFQWFGMSDDGETVLLHKFGGEIPCPPHATPAWIDAQKAHIRRGAVIDTETTGLNPREHQVIEIAVRLFLYHRETGEVVQTTETYTGLQDPGQPLDESIQKITGLTDADLAGQRIDWGQVTALLSSADLIIAHKASFDRPFVEKGAPIAAQRNWACSLEHIDWSSKGYPSQKLEILALYHGFFTKAHRALNDVNALLYLLSLSDPKLGKPYLHELVRSAREPFIEICAYRAHFDKKDLLKSRSYRWDPELRVWKKCLFKSGVEVEMKWLVEKVYLGEFLGQSREIPLLENFRSE